MSVKVIIVDSHPVVRRGLAIYLRLHKEITIVDEVADGQEAFGLLRAVQKLKRTESLPQVAILDLYLRGNISGWATIETFRQEFPATKIFINAFWLSQTSFLRARQLGVQDFFIKNADTSLLANAVKSANDAESSARARQEQERWLVKREEGKQIYGS
jgi:DNA-binding NarL/FixJ family response regulator